MKIYEELAEWWPLLSEPEEYAEEAGRFYDLIREARGGAPRTLLDLGSGGGNNALHLKAHCELTLVDLSEQMLTVSRTLNPECAHHQGDMRTVRLGRRFDAVLVHDAIEYMTTEDDLRAAIVTAFEHCAPGGVALFVPDFVRETFRPGTDHGGSDAQDGRGARYLEWQYDHDPCDSMFEVEFAVLVRHADGTVRVEHDHHTFGLFARDVWLRLLRATGFEPSIATDRWKREIFVSRRPEA